MTGGMGMEGWPGVLAVVGLKGVVLLTMCALTAVVFRRASAAGRHWVWFVGVLGLLALPAGELLAPRWQLSVPGWPSGLPGAPGAPSLGSAPAGREAGRAPLEERSHDAAITTHQGSTSPPAGQRTAATPPPARASSAPAEARAQAPASPRISAATILMFVWAVGTLLLLAALIRSFQAVRVLDRRARPLDPSGRVASLGARLARDMGIGRPVRMLEGEPDAMPMSWGLMRPAVLLPRGAEEWGETRLVAVLLHELAHVRRRDCLTQLVSEVALALHWMNPLAWLATRRLRAEREHACDDRVLAMGAPASTYARELLDLARTYRPVPGSAQAAVALAHSSFLGSRLRAVLDAGRRRSLERRNALVVGTGAAALVLALAALSPAQADSAPAVTGQDQPGPAQPEPGVRLEAPPQATTCGMASSGWQSRTHNVDDGQHRLEWSNAACEVTVRLGGELRFTADFSDVAWLDRDALLRIEERDGSTRRMVEVTPGPDGQPEYAFRLDNRDRPFDPSARGWFQGMLLQVFRNGGYMAEERASALLRSGGVPAVMRELDFLHSDFTFAAYAGALLRQADLSDDQVVNLVTLTRTRVDSDHYMAEILMAVSDRHLSSTRLLDLFVEAASDLDSDHYRAQVLGRALESRDLPARTVSLLIASAAGIDSDHYIAQVLSGVAERYAMDPSIRASYLDAVASIESDHYQAQVLGALVSNHDLTAEEIAGVLEAAEAIGSDSYVDAVLDMVSSEDLRSDEVRRAYLATASHIGSDHYQAQGLSRLISAGTLSADQVRDVIVAIRGVDSDHYKAQLLLEVVDQYDLQGAVREAFLETMRGIGSSHYRGQVAEALLGG